MPGVAGSTLPGTMFYTASTSMVGTAVVDADLDIFDEDSLALVGQSSFTATAAVLASLGLNAVGQASMIFVPAGITIVNFSRGSQIPSSAKPVTVPTIRVVPPKPPQPSFSVSGAGNRNRRREGT
jgi:hypothetical protein